MSSDNAGVSTRLVLVRHGESRATVDQIAGGPLGCNGLTKLGLAQAGALARRLVGTGELEGTTALMSSTLPRAVETAEVLAPALGGLPVITDADLCELLPGEADGLTWEAFAETYARFSMADEPYRPLSPGGESFADFQLRVGRTLTRLVGEHAGGLVVAACHGGVIDGSLRLGLGLAWPATAGQLALIANTSLTEWVCTTSPGQPMRWQLARFNDAAHLASGAKL